ncbi:hypothetical protein OIV83_006135 [Microbotryomycetes sp. JL201]|nr:hypothetical protein OIV83_006135 [Microbotryomycetes sp. JL201]
MSKPGVHASKQATRRLQKEYQAMEKSPPPFVWARPNESNILEWHYILRGPPDSPYHGGEYWGTVTFPGDYPFAPPAIKMNTPSGRFKPSTAICTSMSNFHPGSWNPAWSVNTILIGLLSFMLSDEITTGWWFSRVLFETSSAVWSTSVGSVRSSDSEKRQHATASHSWNIAQPKFRTLFPEYSGPAIKDLPVMGDTAPALPADAPKTNPDVAMPPSSSTLPNAGSFPLDAAAASSLLARIPPDSRSGLLERQFEQQQIDSKGPEAVERRHRGGVLTRWRRELTWTFIILFLVSHAMVSVIARDLENTPKMHDDMTRPADRWSRARTVVGSTIDSDHALYQMGGYCLLTGKFSTTQEGLARLSSAPVFSACYIWPGFQSGNAVQLSLALARLFAAQPRDDRFEIPDQQALCSLIAFLLGASLGRFGDWYGTQKRSWIAGATFLQALLVMAASLCIHFSGEPSIATTRTDPLWHSVLGMATIAFVSASLGLQGFVAKRIKSEFGTSVVLTTVWVELVTDANLFRLKHVRTRDHRVVAIGGLFIGGLFGAALTHTIGAAGAFGVTAGVRVVSAASWLLVPAQKQR